MGKIGNIVSRIFGDPDDDDMYTEGGFIDDDDDIEEQSNSKLKLVNKGNEKQDGNKNNILSLNNNRKKTAARQANGIFVIKPSSIEDARQISDVLRENTIVIVNVEELKNDDEVAQRIIDFATGACYSLDATLRRLSDYMFLLAPDKVEVSGDVMSEVLAQVGVTIGE